MTDELFTYDDLPSSTSIRLIQINSIDDGLIDCSMHTVDLEAEPPYKCLSYTWGDPDPHRKQSEDTEDSYGPDARWPITVNGKIAFIGKNLYDALHEIATPKPSLAKEVDPVTRQTKLHYAAERGYTGLVYHLIQAGADVQAKDARGRTPSDLAAGPNRNEIKELLRKAPSQPSTRHYMSRAGLNWQKSLEYMLDGSKTFEARTMLESLYSTDLAEKLLWIDALCINQENIRERNAQVQMMGRIYEQAVSVTVWLGPCTNSNELKAIHALEKLAYDRFYEKQDFFLPKGWMRSSFENPHVAFTKLGIQDLSLDERMAVARFFQREWFHRTWIIQEVSLAREISVMLGPYQLHWSSIWHASCFITASSWCFKLREMVDSEDDLGTQPMTWRTPSHGLQNSNGPESVPLWKQLVAVRSTRAADPRDKIFGILGCISPPINTNDPAATIVPNYVDSVAKVYTDAAKAVLLDAIDLRLLSQIEDASERVTPNLPSWVPDFNVKGRVPCPLETIARSHRQTDPIYNASKDLYRQIQFHGNNKWLSVDGIRVGQVSATAASSDDMRTNGGNLISLLDLALSLPEMYASPRQPRSEVFWRTLTANVTLSLEYPAPEKTGQGCNEYLMYSLKNYLGPLGSLEMDEFIERTTGYREHVTKLEELGFSPLEYDTQGFRSHHHHEPAPDGDQPAMLTFASALKQAYSGRRLFRTADGRLGIGPHSMRIGDIVWIPLGSIVPLIAREVQGSSNYSLVGDAYVHGIMNGEIVDGEKYELETFILE